MQTAPRALGRRPAAGRVLEAHVGQLPQQVVDAARSGRRDGASAVVGVEPEHVVGRARRRALARRRSRRSSTPHAGARGAWRRRTRASSASGPTTSDDVAGAHDGAQGGDHVGRRRHGDRGERPLAHDHRVHELDGHVVGVLGRARRRAPHGGAGGEPAGQGERGGGQVVGQRPERLVALRGPASSPLLASAVGRRSVPRLTLVPEPGLARAGRRRGCDGQEGGRRRSAASSPRRRRATSSTRPCCCSWPRSPATATASSTRCCASASAPSTGPSVYRALADLEGDGLLRSWSASPTAGSTRHVYARDRARASPPWRAGWRSSTRSSRCSPPCSSATTRVLGRSTVDGSTVDGSTVDGSTVDGP